ncbi:MAG: phosphomethylpyrimidine synthase ThiC [Candidatus Omnitrophica bacterium]|nr:phosphomethylpyrimidine synthase ThiC [Candidatus Omnitrophota bacterium]MCM8790302.1 phosphomethylpyrimidine synthase ThiC [Candidatus Omnitrophota bacterium]
MTQIEAARAGKLTAEMRQVAREEGVSPEFIRKGICRGHIVIPKNSISRISKVCGIGEGLRTKINANIGTSRGSSGLRQEIKKMNAAVELGSDTVMDLSTGADIARTRRAIISKSKVPVGTVPIYEIAINGMTKHGSIKKISVDEMFGVLEDQASDGVDFFTIHAGVVKSALETLRKKPRILDIVSRGGAFIAQWMMENDAENPFYTHFDRVIEIAKKYDITLSLGDGLRPGAIADATDSAQVLELLALGELQQKALKKGVQVMIEGPGHLPLHHIEMNVALEKACCNGAPFYVLGPLVTDIAPGYDHITAAIGGALAGAKGADFLCYVTPSEHLRLPTVEDVMEGVIAAKIAAHAADIAKGVKNAINWDNMISRARKARDWKRQFELAIDKVRPTRYRKSSRPDMQDVCTMCGEYCSIKTAERCFGKAVS